MKLITAKELDDHKFNAHTLLPGYDMDEVDEEIDKAVNTLKAYEHKVFTRPDTLKLMEAAYVLRHKFHTSKKAQRVADYLDNLTNALEKEAK